MKLAFSLESWAGCGGDDTFATTAALTEGQGHADKAIEIFKEVSTIRHQAYKNEFISGKNIVVLIIINFIRCFIQLLIILLTVCELYTLL